MGKIELKKDKYVKIALIKASAKELVEADMNYIWRAERYKEVECN